MTTYTPMFDYAALDAAAVASEPFPYLIVPGFITPQALPRVAADYPEIGKPGSFPTPSLTIGRTFQDFLDELQGLRMRDAFASKFAMDLSDRPTMVTVRGRARARDGKIHTDSASKLITVLIYMNEGWEEGGGRLRLLRSSDSLEDYVAEVPPDQGTLIAFKVTPTSWHGHAPFDGPRRVIQLNWVTSDEVVRHEQNRHRFSAAIKKLMPSFGRAA